MKGNRVSGIVADQLISIDDYDEAVDRIMRLEGLLRTVMSCGVEYSERYGEVRGYDPHGNTRLTLDEDHILRSVMGLPERAPSNPMRM